MLCSCPNTCALMCSLEYPQDEHFVPVFVNSQSWQWSLASLGEESRRKMLWTTSLGECTAGPLWCKVLYQRIHTTKDFFVKVFGTGDHLNVCFPRTLYQCGSGSVNFDNMQLKEVSRGLGQIYHPEWCNCKRGAKASPAGRWILAFSLVLHQPILCSLQNEHKQQCIQCRIFI